MSLKRSTELRPVSNLTVLLVFEVTSNTYHLLGPRVLLSNVNDWTARELYSLCRLQ